MHNMKAESHLTLLTALLTAALLIAGVHFSKHVKPSPLKYKKAENTAALPPAALLTAALSCAALLTAGSTLACRDGVVGNSPTHLAYCCLVMCRLADSGTTPRAVMGLSAAAAAVTPPALKGAVRGQPIVGHRCVQE